MNLSLPMFFCIVSIFRQYSYIHFWFWYVTIYLFVFTWKRYPQLPVPSGIERYSSLNECTFYMKSAVYHCLSMINLFINYLFIYLCMHVSLNNCLLKVNTKFVWFLCLNVISIANYICFRATRCFLTLHRRE